MNKASGKVTVKDITDHLKISRGAFYLYYVHLGIFSPWFYSGMNETPEEIADIIIELSFKPFFNLLTTIS